MPFSTLVLGEYGNLAAAVWVYAVNMLGLGLSGGWLWRHATRGHLLVDPDLDDGFIRYMQARAFATPAAAIIVILASLVIGGSASTGWLLIWLFQILIRRRYHAPEP